MSDRIVGLILASIVIVLATCLPAFAAEQLSAKWKGGRAVSVNVSPTTQPATLGIWWFGTDGTLRAIHSVSASDRGGEQAIELPADGRWAALSGGKLEVFVQGDYAAIEVAVPAMDIGQAVAGKPMANGKYLQAELAPQRWYVDDNHKLIWDGKPWIAWGAMYGSILPLYKDKTPEQLRDEWANHHKTLDRVQSLGLNSLYFNMGYHAPVEERQRVLDDMNRRGMTFGWQLAGGAAGDYAYQGYLVRRTQKQGLLIGQCKDPGKLAVKLPKSKIFELLLVSTDPDKPEVRRFERKMDLADPNQQLEFIVIGVAKDATAKTVDAVVDIPGLPAGSYYVIIRATVKAHLANVWGNIDKLTERHKYLTELKWGKGLRFFVDPIENEGGFYNGAEPVRVYTEAFNRDYAGWLSKRYATVGELAAAWRLPESAVDSFDAASRLVPLCDADADWSDDKLLWIDPSTQKVFETQNGIGGGWFDYTEGVRVTYAACRDEIAKNVKKMVNVPVVNKQVSSWTAPEAINTTPGGFDGVGLELYPGKGNLISQTGAAGAMEARLGAQTTWIICTEMGYRPEKDNGGIKNFPDEQYVDKMVRQSASLGASGFMFFGYSLQPRAAWPNHQLDEDLEQLRWIANARDRLLANWPQSVILGQSFPEGQNWWWKSGGEPLTRYSGVVETAPSLIPRSVKFFPDSPSGADLWAVSGAMPYPSAAIRLVNLSRTESAEHYGPTACKWIKANEKVIYYGALPKANNIDELSRHFTDEMIDTPAGRVQVLNKLPDDVVLASHEGKVWAKRSGNLLVVSLAKGIENPDVLYRLPELDPRWVTELLSGGGK